MAQVPRPTALLGQPTVLTADQIRALLGACAGPAFEYLRDAALIRLFVETGLRLTEMALLETDDVDLDARAGDIHIAYQVVGDGPMDLVFVDQWFSNVRITDGLLARDVGTRACRCPRRNRGPLSSRRLRGYRIGDA